MGTPVPYERGGRSQQKSRTRDALVAAARALFSEGITPTVEQAAERAGISRTTSYRYFTNQAELLAAVYPELSQPSLVKGDSDDPRERLEQVLVSIGRQILDHELELRAMLALSLQRSGAERGEIPLRKGRALAWIEDALKPLKSTMRPAALRRLALSIRAVIGIEPYVWLTDVGGVAPNVAIDIMQTSARTLLAAATE